MTYLEKCIFKSIVEVAKKLIEAFAIGFFTMTILLATFCGHTMFKSAFQRLGLTGFQDESFFCLRKPAFLQVLEKSEIKILF